MKSLPKDLEAQRASVTFNNNQAYEVSYHVGFNDGVTAVLKHPMIAKLEDAISTYHRECEDPWYSCPKSEEGCINEGAGIECTCGADENVKLLAEYRAWREGR